VKPLVWESTFELTNKPSMRQAASAQTTSSIKKILKTNSPLSRSCFSESQVIATQKLLDMLVGTMALSEQLVKGGYSMATLQSGLHLCTIAVATLEYERLEIQRLRFGKEEEARLWGDIKAAYLCHFHTLHFHKTGQEYPLPEDTEISVVAVKDFYEKTLSPTLAQEVFPTGLEMQKQQERMDDWQILKTQNEQQENFLIKARNEKEQTFVAITLWATDFYQTLCEHFAHDPYLLSMLYIYGPM
jgi:hypothetical protein